MDLRQETRGRALIGAAVGLGCGLLALGPGLKPGYLLFYDMVFVPQLPLSERTLGIDGSVPRAVPSDLVVSLLSSAMPGWIVQKILLLVVFVLVGAGAASFFRSRAGAVAAAVCAAWNPYVGERLAIGHWGFLLGYACLPFLIRAALRYRRNARRGLRGLLVWSLLIALTGSTGAILGLIATASVLTVPGDGRSWPARLRSAATALAVFVVANSTWWFPFLFLAPRDAADPAGVQAFMSRADTPLGLIPSVITGGGIWNQGVWFAGRDSVLVALVALAAVTLVCAVAVRTRRRYAQPVAWNAVAAAGVVGLVVACLSALPGGTTLVTWVVTHVPGGGLLRDSQKFAGLWMLTVALATGMCAQASVARARATGAGRTAALGAAALVALWPLATFSGMAFGAGGKWRAVQYPASFTAMARTIDRLPPGRVAVFPWNLYRRYAWDHDVVALDPWQRLVDRDVLVNDDLPLSSRVVKGESVDAARITAAIAAGGDLPAALKESAVRYVLVQTDQPGASSVDLGALRTLAVQAALRLYEVPGAQPAQSTGGPRWRWSGLVGPPLVLAAAAGTHLRPRRRRKRAARKGDSTRG